MKTIRIKILGHPISDRFGYSFFLYSTLQKHYSVELSEQPDYVFYHDSTPEFSDYPNAIKIFYTGENISPNFNECDYAISFDRLTFGDRHFRLPLYIIAPFYSDEEFKLAGEKFLERTRKQSEDDLRKKNKFCSFVFSNYRATNQRKEIFETLSSYLRVDSAGSFLNNTNTKVKNKLAYEMEHKFVIAFENSSRSGYVTEKIVSAFAAGAIPVYWGDPDIHLEFNPHRFVNCHNYSSYDEILEQVKYLNENNNAYIEMVNQPILAEGNNPTQILENFELFLKNIFDQPIASAKRNTINPVKLKHFEKERKLIRLFWKTHATIVWLTAKAYKPFKKIQYLENLKMKFLK
jgi:hypothetical protein